MDTTPVSLLERLNQPGTASGNAAWDRFVELYTPLLHTWASGINLSETDAADLVQDVFVILLRKLPEFRYDPGQSFRGWLRAVMRNQWRDRQRRAVVPAVDNLHFVADAGAPDPGEVLADREYQAYLVRRALELMHSDFEPATWQACWQMAAEDRPAEEVARNLGLSVAAVYAANYRVLRRLRQDLAGFLD
jgi:RNA polymerase sigma-70 factor (ECF subfamily)